MKMDVVAGSGNDEFYTPNYAIKPLMKYLDENRYYKIHCPFDTEESNYYKLFSKEGFLVKTSHIQNGEDFFEQDFSW